MTNEEAIEILSDVGDINRCCAEDAEALDMAIKALEMVNDFETAQIITGGRLNGRTYAYKCGLVNGLVNGKRLVLDEISTEIEEIETYDGLYIDRAYVLEIIDKYRKGGVE